MQEKLVEFEGVLMDTVCYGNGGQPRVNVTYRARGHTVDCMLTCFDYGSGFVILDEIVNEVTEDAPL